MTTENTLNVVQEALLEIEIKTRLGFPREEMPRLPDLFPLLLPSLLSGRDTPRWEEPVTPTNQPARCPLQPEPRSPVCLRGRPRLQQERSSSGAQAQALPGENAGEH